MVSIPRDKLVHPCLKLVLSIDFSHTVAKCMRICPSVQLPSCFVSTPAMYSASVKKASSDSYRRYRRPITFDVFTTITALCYQPTRRNLFLSQFGNVIPKIRGVAPSPPLPRISLSDASVRQQAASADVHSCHGLNVEEAGSRLRLLPQVDGRMADPIDARLLARPILQEYLAFTVDEVARHPAEF